MTWWKTAKESVDFGERVKQHIRSSPFFVGLFKKFNLPLDLMDENLQISEKRLDKSFCEANEHGIIVDDRLAEDADFFTYKFHFIAHEIFHWLRRQVEKRSYFADPEEVESFNTAIAYQLFNTRDVGGVMREFLPLIKVTIKDDIKAKDFLKHRIEDAEKLLQEMSLCNFSF